MQMEREAIRAALEKKGFRLKESRTHDYYRLYVDDKKTSVFTYLSRGSGYKTYGDDLIEAVYKQMRLVKKELVKFVDCELEYLPYITLLRRRGHIQ
ncbi:MAG: type II toxin-antitoxin system HicA family toxin [Ignavibacteriae bacterium]|nr:type II toxin-antitoxin system HicA family toxin [Ignavibacteriota bacterium]